MAKTKHTASVELTLTNLVALTGINRTSLKHIFNHMESLGHSFEVSPHGKRTFTERELHILKQITKLKNKHKISYENALNTILEPKTEEKPAKQKNVNTTQIQKKLEELESLMTEQEKQVLRHMQEMKQTKEYITQIKEELQKL